MRARTIRLEAPIAQSNPAAVAGGAGYRLTGFPDHGNLPNECSFCRAMSRPLRSDNRLLQLLDHAARQFREKGFQGCSVRDIVGAIRMLPGSLYYHFPNKEALLVAVYEEGVRRIGAAVEAAMNRQSDPWLRLEAACAAHLEALLEDSDYAQVVIRVRPEDAPGAAARLVALRDEYDALFSRVLRTLPLRSRTDRRVLRLMLLGALNWAQTWYRPGGASPRRLARQFVRLLADPLRPTPPAGQNRCRSGRKC